MKMKTHCSTHYCQGWGKCIFVQTVNKQINYLFLKKKFINNVKMEVNCTQYDQRLIIRYLDKL